MAQKSKAKLPGAREELLPVPWPTQAGLPARSSQPAKLGNVILQKRGSQQGRAGLESSQNHYLSPDYKEPFFWSEWLL